MNGTVVFVFVHVCKTSVGMFILNYKYVQSVYLPYSLSIKYYILQSYVQETLNTVLYDG